MRSTPIQLRRLILGLALAAPLYAAGSAGAATCGYDPATQTVSIALAAEDQALGRSGDELVLLAGTDCGDATVGNTTTVNVTGSPADELFRVAYHYGPLPGIDVHVDLGASVVQDSLLVFGTAERDYITVGAGAINVSPRELDPDVFFVDEHVYVESAEGDDVLSGQGGAGTGGPLLTGAGWTGGPGDDRITGGDGSDLVVPGLGDDVVDGKAGANGLWYLDAPAGVNASFVTGTVTGGSGNDTIAGFQSLTGSEFDDVISGGVGNDGLDGRGGNDLVAGRDGDDDLSGAAGNDTLWGATGTDRAVYNAAPAGVKVDLQAGTASGGDGVDTLAGVENVIGTEFDDQLAGTAGSNRLQALGGNDVLTGRGGDDALWAGDGVDGASYLPSPGPVVVDLTAGTSSGAAGNDHLTEVENVFGSSFNDVLTGTAAANVLSGLAGIDRLRGLDGDDLLVGSTGGDWLVGGNGNDQLTPGAGSDLVHGEAGRDRVVYSGVPNAVLVSLTTGVAQTGADGKDTLTGVEDVFGSAFGDHIRGNAQPNAIDGGAGHDWLYGFAGPDVLLGNLGNDRLHGGFGFDTCVQGLGVSPIGWPKSCP